MKASDVMKLIEGTDRTDEVCWAILDKLVHDEKSLPREQANLACIQLGFSDIY